MSSLFRPRLLAAISVIPLAVTGFYYGAFADHLLYDEACAGGALGTCGLVRMVFFIPLLVAGLLIVRPARMLPGTFGAVTGLTLLALTPLGWVAAADRVSVLGLGAIPTLGALLLTSAGIAAFVSGLPRKQMA